ncbi:MAG TPA: 23S rRNA (guanosine(2251)-2'-O)-methyltransferase RlmB [Methylococcaceae bacterium]|nr:23S rRNA (guanosine(2251)-2'-O)-methyltransferase RlmB [Methylococcaceae bacterium]
MSGKSRSLVFGLHAARSALEHAPENVVRAWLSGREDQRIAPLLEMLKARGIPVEFPDRKRLDRMADGQPHQGVALEVVLPPERGESELFQALQDAPAPALLLVLDQVQDPHNLGACLRSADATGALGVVVPRDQSVGLTPTVCKVASGAAETVPLYRVTNLARTLRELKDAGLWIVGAAGEAERTAYETDLTMPLALVMGAEGKGLRRLTREYSDLLVKLPMLGRVESLNLSVATGVLLYEVLRQRAAAVKKC